MTKFKYSGLISIAFLFSLQKSIAQNEDARFASACIGILTDVIIHDITSPPVASRDYVYTLIAFYEACRNENPKYKSYAGQLNDLKSLPQRIPGMQYDWLIAGASAFYKTGYGLVFSKDLFKKEWDSIAVFLKKRKNSEEVYKRSFEFGEQVALGILKWSKEDNYGLTRSMPRYTPLTKPGYWLQTAPDFMEAVEPYWGQIRTMTLSSADEIPIPPPSEYMSEKFMAEYNEMLEVNRNISKEQKWMADFWDCNPFAIQTVGHLMYSVKKISPGGHWIGITSQVIKKNKQSLVEALASYSLVSVALFDAFIASWKEKYRSNYIRPITAMQSLYSPTWEPRLQTPPFPEYPSAHSVISNASAVVLTSIYGDHYAYTDSVEKPYGVQNRSFHSFYDASKEAAMSRLYGGIHFREAIDNGSELGRKIGEHIVEKVVLLEK
jgi:hypothetical protein